MRKFWPPLIPLFFVTLVLEVLVRTGLIAAFILPPPSAVFAAIIENRYELLQGFLVTGGDALAALTASCVAGIALAVILAQSSFLKRTLYPYAIFFQTVPVISIAPLLVIWFGFGQPTVVVCAWIVSIFPVIANTLLGFDSTDASLDDLLTLYGASRWQRLLRLKLPSALPFIFSGLKIAAGLAVIGAIVGEFIAGGGLGEIVDAARTQQRIDLLFAAVLMSSFLGLVMVSLIGLFNWLALRRWHPSLAIRSAGE